MPRLLGLRAVHSSCTRCKDKTIAALRRGKGRPHPPKATNEVWVVQRKSSDWLDGGTPGQRGGVSEGGASWVRWGEWSGE